MLLIFLIELIKDILAMAGRRRHARNKAVITAVRSQWHWFLTCKIYNISHCTLWTHFGSCINVKKKKPFKKKEGKGWGKGGSHPNGENILLSHFGPGVFYIVQRGQATSPLGPIHLQKHPGRLLGPHHHWLCPTVHSHFYLAEAPWRLVQITQILRMETWCMLTAWSKEAKPASKGVLGILLFGGGFWVQIIHLRAWQIFDSMITFSYSDASTHFLF